MRRRRDPGAHDTPCAEADRGDRGYLGFCGVSAPCPLTAPSISRQPVARNPANAVVRRSSWRHSRTRRICPRRSRRAPFGRLSHVPKNHRACLHAFVQEPPGFRDPPSRAARGRSIRPCAKKVRRPSRGAAARVEIEIGRSQPRAEARGKIRGFIPAPTLPAKEWRNSARLAVPSRRMEKTEIALAYYVRYHERPRNKVVWLERGCRSRSTEGLSFFSLSLEPPSAFREYDIASSRGRRRSGRGALRAIAVTTQPTEARRRFATCPRPSTYDFFPRACMRPGTGWSDAGRRRGRSKGPAEIRER